MTSTKREYGGFLKSISLLFGGLAVGWLVGLSVSPVIQTVLTSLIAIVVSISSALAGLKLGRADEDQQLPEAASKQYPKLVLDPLPITFMVIGIAVGASCGVYARTNNWLGPKRNTFVEEWKGTELGEKEILSRIFNSLYPPTPKGPPANDSSSGDREPTGSSSARPSGNSATSPGVNAEPKRNALLDQRVGGVLFNVSLDDCKRLRNANEDELRSEMASSGEPLLNDLAKNCKELKCLKAGVKTVCAKYPE